MQSRPRGCMYATWRLFSFCRTPCARRHARVCKARCVACCARMLVCMCASARTCVLTLLRRRVCALTIALHDVRACTAMDCLAQETALNKRSTCRRCPVRADGALLGQTVPCSGRRCPYSNIFFSQLPLRALVLYEYTRSPTHFLSLTKATASSLASPPQRPVPTKSDSPTQRPASSSLASPT